MTIQHKSSDLDYSVFFSYVFYPNDKKYKLEIIDEFDNVTNEFNFNYDQDIIIDSIPFNFKLSKKILEEDFGVKIDIYPLEQSVMQNMKRFSVSETGKESDQLDLQFEYPNRKIALDYLNELISQFDQDGIYDRQLEYKRTLDFVDNRSTFLKAELEQVENKAG